MSDASGTKVLGICGSLRKGSYNAALARALPALAPEGMHLTDAPRVDTMPHYNYDDQVATGFLVQSLLALWLYQRFQISVTAAAPMIAQGLPAKGCSGGREAQSIAFFKTPDIE